jgi:hypothetical protein
MLIIAILLCMCIVSFNIRGGSCAVLRTLARCSNALEDYLLLFLPVLLKLVDRRSAGQVSSYTYYGYTYYSFTFASCTASCFCMHCGCSMVIAAQSVHTNANVYVIVVILLCCWL